MKIFDFDQVYTPNLYNFYYQYFSDICLAKNIFQIFILKTWKSYAYIFPKDY